MFKPQLPRNWEPDKVKFPVAAQKKWDGERILWKDGVCLSRSLKPITNQWLIDELQSIFTKSIIPLDGEIQINGTFADTSGFVRKSYREADFIFHVFDTPTDGLTYQERYNILKFALAAIHDPRIVLEDYTVIESMEELTAFHAVNAENVALDGTIIRNLDSVYKHGRATLKEGHALKIKDFDDDEGTIIACNERMQNNNPKTINELGRSVRSSHMANLLPTGMLATYTVDWNGVTFDVTATGSLDSRKDRWDDRESLIGKLVKFQYMGVSPYGVPRHPVELGIRDPEDL